MMFLIMAAETAITASAWVNAVFSIHELTR